MKKEQSKQLVVRSAAAMSVGTLSSRILGVVRDMMLAALFSKTVTDAFVVAFRLPNMFRRLLGEGSLSVSFIPIYIEKKTPDEKTDPEAAKKAAQDLANGILTLLVTLGGTLSALGVIFMEPLMSLLVGREGFLAVEGKLDITIYLGRVMFSYLFLVMLYAYYMAIANSWKKFLIPAMAPALFNLTFIFFALIPDGSLGFQPGEFLAWGVLVGGCVQVSLVGRLLWQMKLLPRLRFRPWSASGVKLVLVNMVPGVIGLGVLQLISLVNLNLASRLPEGSHSFIYWGDRILELPQSLIAVSLGAALLPALSQLHAENKHEEMLKAAREHLRLLLFLTLPSAVGVFLISQTLVEALFMRGQFSRVDVMATASVTQVYAFLLVASSFSRVLVSSFYARKNTWLPATVSVVTLVFHVTVALYTTEWFGLLGLVGATTLSGFFNATVLSICYRTMIGNLGMLEALLTSWRWLPGLVSMGSWVWVVQFIFFMLWPERGSLSCAIVLLVAVVPALFLYLGFSARLKVPEAQKVIGVLRRRLQGS